MIRISAFSMKSLNISSLTSRLFTVKCNLVTMRKLGVKKIQVILPIISEMTICSPLFGEFQPIYYSVCS